MKILVIAPTSREFANISAAIAAARGQMRHSYSAVCSGIGKAGAAVSVARALAGDNFDAIAVVGFAAGSASFRQGDIVAPRTARYHDCRIPDGFIPELTDPCPLAAGDDVTVFTGDSFVDAAMIADIKERFGVERAIFDMEITAVAIAAKMCGRLPVVAVKMISDVPEEGHTEHSYDEFADSHSDFSPLLRRIEQLFTQAGGA